MPPIAVYQLQIDWLTHCYRGQAPSHIWFSYDIGFSVCQMGRLLIALRNATNHFTNSCGSIGFASFIIHSLE